MAVVLRRLHRPLRPSSARAGPTISRSSSSFRVEKAGQNATVAKKLMQAGLGRDYGDAVRSPVPQSRNPST